MQMKHFSLLTLMVATFIVMACQQQKNMPPLKQTKAIDSSDSTLYGLICEGSNDSILVFLPDPYDGSDPDTLDILYASRQHQVFGRLQVGDRVAIMPDTVGNKRASVVIVTSGAKSTSAVCAESKGSPKAFLSTFRISPS